MTAPDSVLIVLAYYDRPNFVRLALESVRWQTDPRWHLAFIDDGSAHRGEDVLRDFGALRPIGKTYRLGDFYRIDDTPDQKRAQGGSRHGEFMTRAIRECPGDLVVILCDDDALHPDLVGNALAWFAAHPEAQYGYGSVIVFDPRTDRPPCAGKPTGLNRHAGPIRPSCMVDSAQVVYRASAVRERGCAYPSPATGALDSSMYAQLWDTWGDCPPMGFVTQYKGEWDGQMGRRADLLATVDVDV